MFISKKKRSFNPFGLQIGNGFNPLGLEIAKTRQSAESQAFWQSIETESLSRQKKPGSDLKRAYKKALEFGFLITLASLNGLIQLIKGFEIETWETQPIAIKIEAEDIPVTEQVRRPPPPPRPQVPVPSESENVPEDLTIVSTELALTELPPPPAPPTEDDAMIFVAFDTPPQPVGGLAALYENLVYPPVAWRAGIEALIVTRILVSKRGQVEDVQILKGSDSALGFEDAVVAAVHKLKWRPAMQRERPVKVWVTIPVQFALARSVNQRASAGNVETKSNTNRGEQE